VTRDWINAGHITVEAVLKVGRLEGGGGLVFGSPQPFDLEAKKSKGTERPNQDRADFNAEH